MRLNDKFNWAEKCYIMAIVNATPDSFSGDGIYNGDNILDMAISQAENFIENGADILDIGGESTRPNAKVISADEETSRVIPIITALSDRFPDIVISIDSYKSDVARAAITAGAHIINDVSGLLSDKKMTQVAVEYNAPVIIMHNRSRPQYVVDNGDNDHIIGGEYIAPNYIDFLNEIKLELIQLKNDAIKRGIDANQIILDPGIGFGKSVTENMMIINHLDKFKDLDMPLLLGVSRKSFIGHILNLKADQRLEGTAASVAIGVMRGANIMRVHDVMQMSRIVKMCDAILRAE